MTQNYMRSANFMGKTRTPSASSWTSDQEVITSPPHNIESPAQSDGLKRAVAAPAGGRHAHEGQLHGIGAIQQGMNAGRRRRAPLGVLAPEELARRLPKVADLVLHCRALPAHNSFA